MPAPKVLIVRRVNRRPVHFRQVLAVKVQVAVVPVVVVRSVRRVVPAVAVRLARPVALVFQVRRVRLVAGVAEVRCQVPPVQARVPSVARRPTVAQAVAVPRVNRVRRVLRAAVVNREVVVPVRLVPRPVPVAKVAVRLVASQAARRQVPRPTAVAVRLPVQVPQVPRVLLAVAA